MALSIGPSGPELDEAGRGLVAMEGDHHGHEGVRGWWSNLLEGPSRLHR